MSEPFVSRVASLTHAQHPISIAYAYRPGEGEVFVFVHGLGCAKEDYAAAWESDALNGRALLAFDQPGCGASPYPAGAHLSLGDIADLTKQLLDMLEIKRAILVGHSSGGIATQIFAERYPEMTAGHVSVEGTFALDPASFARELVKGEDAALPELYVEAIRRIRLKPDASFQRYASQLESQTSPQAYKDYERSLIQEADHGNFVERFKRDKCARCFVCGALNEPNLGFLPEIRNEGIAVFSIKDAHHFPMIDQPDLFYRVLGSWK